MNLKKNFLITISLIVSLIFFSGCSGKKEDDANTPIVKKVFEPNVQKRAEAYRDLDGGILGNFKKKNSGIFDFANSNVLWRASLKALENIPLQSVSYSGGVLISDWYGNNKESLKIQINFKSDKLATSSIEVKSFKKICSSDANCQVMTGTKNFNAEIKNKILSQARSLSLEEEKKKKN